MTIEELIKQLRDKGIDEEKIKANLMSLLEEDKSQENIDKEEDMKMREIFGI